MNFYKRFIGDYARDTGHLSIVEHGAYGLLLDWYYANEKAIPADKAYRIAKASTKDERAAVDNVLTEFFFLENNRWISVRCELEILKASDKAKKAQESANTRWHGCERNANASKTHMPSQSLRNASHSQTPDSREDQEPRPTVLSPADADDEPAGKPRRIPYQQVVDAYNETCGDMFPQVSRLTDKRRKAIRARWLADTTNDNERKRTNSVDYWRRYFSYCRSGITFFAKAAAGESRGDHAGWRPDFDFLMTERAWLGVREGKYQ